MSEPYASGQPAKLGSTLRSFGATTLGMLQTRVEILALELAEERGNLARLLLVVFAIVACLQLAIVMGLVFLFLVVSEEHRVVVLGSVAGAMLLAVAGGVFWLRAWLRSRPPMFGTTIAELRKDRDWIRGRS